ncbi:MAG: tetratricopeptide repeat protein [Cyanobacteria bacterium P01_D01_bin.1]
MTKLQRLLILGICAIGLGGTPILADAAVARIPGLSSAQNEEFDRTTEAIRQSVELTEQRRFEEARSLAEEAFVTRGNLLGIEHPEVLSALSNIANIYYAEGDYGSAAALYDRVVMVTATNFVALGPESPNRRQAAIDSNRVFRAAAEPYIALQDYENAIELYKVALSVQEEALGTSHPEVADTLEEFAAVYRVQGDDAAALLLEERALSIRQPGAEN